MRSICNNGNYNEWSSFYWQAEEAREHCKACQIDVGEKRVDLANTKSEIITQLREMVSQCDLTLKAVSPVFCGVNIYSRLLEVQWLLHAHCCTGPYCCNKMSVSLLELPGPSCCWFTWLIFLCKYFSTQVWICSFLNDHKMSTPKATKWPQTVMFLPSIMLHNSDEVLVLGTFC